MKHKTRCDVPRAAEILGKSRWGIYKDVAERRIPFRKFGKRVYFFEEELFELLDSAPGVRLEDLETASR